MALYVCGEVHVSLPVLVAVHFIYGASNCAALSCYSLIAEIVDDAWIRTGHRNDGTLHSMVSFGTKLGNVFGGSLGILDLGTVGFVANTDMTNKLGRENEAKVKELMGATPDDSEG